jgi:hypothetical protein
MLALAERFLGRALDRHRSASAEVDCNDIVIFNLLRIFTWYTAPSTRTHHFTSSVETIAGPLIE